MLTFALSTRPRYRARPDGHDTRNSRDYCLRASPSQPAIGLASRTQAPGRWAALERLDCAHADDLMTIPEFHTAVRDYLSDGSRPS